MEGHRCRETVRAGIYCDVHGKARVEQWHRDIADELQRRRVEARTYPPIFPEHLRPKIRLTPPSLTPDDFTLALPGAGMGFVVGSLKLLGRLLSSGIGFAGLAAVCFLPMLAIGAIGIFVMAFIGAGVAMLKMAAY